MRLALIRNTIASIILIIALLLFTISNQTHSPSLNFIAICLCGYVVAVMLVNANAYAATLKDKPTTYSAIVRYMGMICFEDADSGDVTPMGVFQFYLGLIIFPLYEVVCLIGNMLIGLFGINPRFGLITTIETLDPPLMSNKNHVKRMF